MTDPQIDVSADKDGVAHAAAERLLATLAEVLATKDEAHLGLTGGSLGSAIWAAVAASPAKDSVDWSKVRVWWGDERYLPAGDADRNDVQNDEAGLASLRLDPEKVHRVDGPDRSPDAEESAAAYAATVREHGHGAFDVMLLGVGPDGHVASLFPGHPAQLTSDAITVAVHESPKPPPDRVSLTFEALNRSDRVWFIVAGADKARAVADGIAGAPAEQSSAAQVRGSTETVWFVDEAAATDL
ncbi:6-phosphogluconolactonase [Knoellia koreensis]|uniref:6-phosphogluconolactonase n=1 Tax=Knoellia koreensis TaxID=2730921 RepID=A0A849HF51_9MICO|nr:6-phosphogluconolactonase [Knoellia sp. DB2414S]NNM44841.1 6-phosphogluconolactonase [Knoellia sp. DB2414S]